MLKRCMAGSILCAATVIAFGQSDEISYKFQQYSDNNNVKVSTNVIRASKRINDHFSLSLSGLVDAISAASRRDVRSGSPLSTGASVSLPRTPSASVDGITSASPTDEKRLQPSATVTFTNDFIKMLSSDKSNDDPTTFSITGINSEENDYTARTVSAAISQDLFQRNTTLGFRFGKIFSRYHPAVRFVPSPSDAGWSYFGDGRRETDNLSASITQGLTTTTIISAVAGYSYDRGYLTRPYNVYRVGDQFRHEYLPSEHRSITFSGLFNQYIGIGNGMAVHLEYRYYEDSWEQKSTTVGMEIYSYIGERFILRPSFRIYSQSSAFFYRDYYSAEDRYLTTDLKYRGGNSYTFGLKGSYVIKDFVKPDGIGFPGIFPVAIDIGADYYLRASPADPQVLYSHYNYYHCSSEFNALWVQSGIRFAY